MLIELTPPINVNRFKDPAEVFNEAYLNFQVDFIYQNNRPKLFNKRIVLDELVSYDNKINGFWHIASIGENDTISETMEKYDMDPCINDFANSKCIYDCDINHTENFLKDINRIPCLFRASRIIWVKEIIELLNNNPNHTCIKVWKQKNTNTKEKTLKIRYTKDNIDFIIIFKIFNTKDNSDIDYYRLITAYPLVLKSYKKRFDKEYRKYCESKSKK
jgi:hypothetical protein